MLDTQETSLSTSAVDVDEVKTRHYHCLEKMSRVRDSVGSGSVNGGFLSDDEEREVFRGQKSPEASMKSRSSNMDSYVDTHQ